MNKAGSGGATTEESLKSLNGIAVFPYFHGGAVSPALTCGGLGGDRVTRGFCQFISRRPGMKNHRQGIAGGFGGLS